MQKPAARSARIAVVVVALGCFVPLGNSIAREFGNGADSSVDEACSDWLGDRLAANFSKCEWSMPPGSWSMREVENFQIYVNGASKDELADVAAACEASLELLASHRRAETSSVAWQPKCILVLHRTFQSYQNALGSRAASSWGCATIKSSRGAITSRRIDICATTPKRLAETFPHELTHVVLADRFAGRTVPRWLDEGLAVLAEPRSKIATRAKALAQKTTARCCCAPPNCLRSTVIRLVNSATCSMSKAPG